MGCKMLVQSSEKNRNQLQLQQNQSSTLNSSSSAPNSHSSSSQVNLQSNPLPISSNSLTSDSNPVQSSSLILESEIGISLEGVPPTCSSRWNTQLISDSANNNSNNHNNINNPRGNIIQKNKNKSVPARPPPPIFNDNLHQQKQEEIIPPEVESSLLGDFDLAASLNNKLQTPLVPQRGSPLDLKSTPNPIQTPISPLPARVWGAGEVKERSLVNSESISQLSKMSDAYLSGVKGDMLKNGNLPKGPTSAPNTPEALRRQHQQVHLNSSSRGHGGHGVSDKKDKMEYNQMMMRSLNEREGSRPLSYHGRSASICLEHQPAPNWVNKRHIMSTGARSRKESLLLNRRSMPGPYLENRFTNKFDVSDLDTNLPRIDLEAIETHLRQARDEERKRRSDREEIRRRLALESDGEMIDKPRKHNLHSRLQSSMNLQICFMNETASDSESPNSDNETHKAAQQPNSLPSLKAQTFEVVGSGVRGVEGPSGGIEDFFAKQARLQAEARAALAQAKEMARLQINQERDGRSHSPITEMVRNSLDKVGVGLPPDRRRVSRQLLTEMNVNQLQVIVNDLHSHIEKLNESLVSMLLERDDLHMEQDSMLVDIEDLTRYLAAKYNSPHQSLPLISASQSILGRK